MSFRHSHLAASLVLIAATAACGGGTATQESFGVDGGDTGGSSGAGASSGSGGAGGSGAKGGTGAVGGTGASGGSGGTAATGGSSAQGGAGAISGDASSCTDSDGTDPSIRSTASGLNGTFSDACDGDGNLTEYLCEVKYEQCQPNCWENCPPCQTLTGQVIPQHFDCNGTCVDGSCVARCPDFGDRLRYEAVDPSGDVTFLNLEDQRRYTCRLFWDTASDAYDCKTSPYAGFETQVTSLGLFGSYCTGGTFGNVGVGVITAASNEACAYECTIAS